MEYGDFPSKGSLSVTWSVLEKSLSLCVSEEDFKMKGKLGSLMYYSWFTSSLMKRLTKKTAPRSRGPSDHLLGQPHGLGPSSSSRLPSPLRRRSIWLCSTPVLPSTLSTPFLGCDAFPQSQISELSALSLDSTYCLCDLFGMFLLASWIVSFFSSFCMWETARYDLAQLHYVVLFSPTRL